ncbi:hypothetical protein OU798_01770 [Prolixibacteraceae bacterium Z1-6]|uniref:Uncharacterized protein n=1 Tax=Draconibacterium aestuarii TaxID=2998507 RepID=A0A9X3F4Z5_9BACT|nr:hypothetical protein [Prolixibacteraceae bacterium Z1-6]
MKTLKVLVTAIFLLLFVLPRSEAQIVKKTVEEIWFREMTECYGGVITGPAIREETYFYDNDGNLRWFIIHTTSDFLMDDSRGETFTLNQFVKERIEKSEETKTFTFEAVLRGDKGSLIMLYKTWEIDVFTNTWTLIKEKSLCL